MSRALFITLLGLLAISASVAKAQNRPLEYPVKAAFLYQFGSFVEWPPGALPDGQRQLQICVVGQDPFGADLDRIVQGQTISGRSITIRRMALISGQSGCHIAFLGGGTEQSVASAARVIQAEPILTVADTVTPGVVVHFVLRANRVRFNIDLSAAKTNRIRVSSKLLKLAVEVRP